MLTIQCETLQPMHSSVDVFLPELAAAAMGGPAFIFSLHSERALRIGQA
jgi:hypothetical protein